MCVINEIRGWRKLTNYTKQMVCFEHRLKKELGKFSENCVKNFSEFEASKHLNILKR